jgi:hypothetical protein
MTFDFIEKAQPKIAPDATFFPLDDGVLLRNPQGTFALKGKGLFSLIEQLAQHLDGQTLFAQTLNKMSEPVASVSRHVMTVLIQRRIFRNHAIPDVHTLSEAELEMYRDTIGYLEHFLDNAYSSFERYRRCPFLLLGPKLFQKGLAQWLLRAGASKILCTEHLSTSELSVLKTIPAHLYEVTQVSLDEGFSESECVLIGMGHTNFTELKHWESYKQKEGKIWLAGFVTPNMAIMGPINRPSQRIPVEVLQRRLALHDLPVSAEENTSFDMTILANMMAFEAFKEVTGCLIPETREGVVFLDREKLTSRRSPLRMGDSTADQTSLPSKLDAWRRAGHIDISDRDFLNSLSELIDDRLGIFESFDDLNLMQLPIKRSKIRIRKMNTYCGQVFYGVSSESLLHARFEVMKAALSYWSLAEPNSVCPKELHPQNLLVEQQDTAHGFGVGVHPDYQTAFRQALIAAYASMLLKSVNEGKRNIQQICLVNTRSTQNPLIGYLLKTMGRFNAQMDIQQISSLSSASVCLGKLRYSHTDLNGRLFVAWGFNIIQAVIQLLLKGLAFVQAHYYDELLPHSQSFFPESLVFSDQYQRTLELDNETASHEIPLVTDLENFGFKISEFYLTPDDLEHTTNIKSLLIKLSL